MGVDILEVDILAPTQLKYDWIAVSVLKGFYSFLFLLTPLMLV